MYDVILRTVIAVPASLCAFLRTLTKSYAFKRLNYEITVLSVNKKRGKERESLRVYAMCLICIFYSTYIYQVSIKFI